MTEAATRARRRAGRGTTAPRRQRNERPTFWEHGEFVAIDGEGFSEGPERYIEIGHPKKGHERTGYTWKDHSYAYLSASDGSVAYSEHRLGMLDCLAFVSEIIERNPLAIVVAFGASYDICHFLCHDIDRENLARAIGKGDGRPCIVTGNGFTYQLDYRPRKCLHIRRWPEGARRWEVNARTGKRQATSHLSVRVWDVWGFFQDSFVGVMEKWVPDDPDYQFIRRMKGGRSIFERSEIEEIKRYNAAELRILVKIMNRVRDALNDLGLKITRWDGAGAVAAAMMTKHKVKAHKGETPDEVFEAARRAYSGGHIEACQLGYHATSVYHFDINSAYPSEFRRLPSLSHGRWISSGGDPIATAQPPAGYTLVKVSFSFPERLPFYPLFYRCEDGAIFYPRYGVGWYWHSEYAAARAYHARLCCDDPVCEARSLTVSQWFHFREDGSQRPFGWVEDYYTRRQSYIRTARLGGFESGPEKIIKLGLNALYGKTAQQVGARVDRSGGVVDIRLPPFFQLDWAGYVTAGCRARMMLAAIQKPRSVIMFATDGLFTTEPLDLDAPKEKTLGAWEAKVHDGITVVMPGVYWLHDGDKVKHYSRGFDKKDMSDCAFVHQAWRERRENVGVKLTRLIGIGSACASKEYWKLRGCFAESRRMLCLDGENSKRYGIDYAAGARPWERLEPLVVRDHELPNILGVPESAPYPISWLDGTTPVRDDTDMIELLEEDDATLA